MGGEALVLGIVALLTWLIPFFGLPIPIIGLVWGIWVLRKKPARRWMALSGVVMCSIGLFLSVGYSVLTFFDTALDITAPPTNGDTTLPPPPPPPPAPPPGSVTWAADGVITEGEYTDTRQLNQVFTLHWKIEGQYIYLAMHADTTGWVAIGIQPEVRSNEDVDLVLGFVTIGGTTIYDIYAREYPSFIAQDLELGGSNDILEYGGSEPAAGFDEDTRQANRPSSTVIEFKRQLQTGDPYDQPFAKGVNIIRWAYGADDSRDSPQTNGGLEIIEL